MFNNGSNFSFQNQNTPNMPKMKEYNFGYTHQAKLPICETAGKNPLTTFDHNIRYQKEYAEKNKMGQMEYSKAMLEYISNDDNLKNYSIEEIRVNDYLNGKIQFYDKFSHTIDFAKIGPAYCTVVQWCISMALYMGFTEIYLLGCDNTSLLVTLKSALKQNDDNDYAYHVTANEKKRMEKLLDYSSVETYTQSYLNNIRQYRYLMEYCQKRNVKLVNCSSTTVLDCIPRMSLDKVING